MTNFMIYGAESRHMEHAGGAGAAGVRRALQGPGVPAGTRYYPASQIGIARTQRMAGLVPGIAPSRYPTLVPTRYTHPPAPDRTPVLPSLPARTAVLAVAKEILGVDNAQ